MAPIPSTKRRRAPARRGWFLRRLFFFSWPPGLLIPPPARCWTDHHLETISTPTRPSTIEYGGISGRLVGTAPTTSETFTQAVRPPSRRRRAGARKQQAAEAARKSVHTGNIYGRATRRPKCVDDRWPEKFTARPASSGGEHGRRRRRPIPLLSHRRRAGR